MCRVTLQESGSPRLIEGYYWSIVLLVSLPLLVFSAAFLQYLKLERRVRQSPPRAAKD